ncbi:hypothetical protein [Conexibacter woesei]|uniref:hypothetical protein n=1 Tax=Conexibacter woesei TaxID=191495 RepID=UPI00047C7809|nr:hypothetical protein [Conexibacter woesei]
MRRPTVLLALLLVVVPAASARAAGFPPPVELVHGAPLLGTASATDAAGNSVLVVTGGGGTRLLERPGPAAPWGAGVRLRGSTKGPVVAAAGAGAAVVAWRNDRPRRYQSIVAMVRDPGVGLWSDPLTVSDDDADGVRHPAVAVDARGDAVLAYNSGTRASHLSMQGAVTVAVRGPRSAFGQAVVVDDVPHAGAPAVAIGPDGRGIVAWVRDRRIWSADVDAVGGTIGRARALTPRGFWSLAHVAAGPGATATVVARETVDDGTVLYAVRRPADGTFAGRRFQVLERFTHAEQRFVQELAVAADDSGRTTVVWSPESFGGPRFTAGIRFAVAGEGSLSFGRPRDLVPEDTPLDCTTPSVAASAGRAAFGWTCSDRKTTTFQTARANRYKIYGPTTVATGTALPTSYFAKPLTLATLDAAGNTTLILTRPDPLQPRTPTTEHVLTTTGR